MEELDELEQFKEQLVQVESLLSLDSSEQLETLKKDLEEAIAIMTAQRSEASTSREEIELDSDSESNEQLNESDQQNEEPLTEYSQLIGERYRVPFVTTNDNAEPDVEMHEAEIIKVLEIDEEDGDARLEVRFLYPLNESMKYCANCEQNDDSSPSECPLNHGYVVHLSMIKNALSSNDLQVYSPCLYNLNGGELWRRGTIANKKLDSFSVKPDASEELILVPADRIRPFDDLKDDDLELIEEDDVIFVAHKKVTLIELSDDEADNHEHDKRSNSGDFAKLGAWEAHTSGFGSKILKKLGYIKGKGLGKNQQGIVDPVQLSILPSNTSLDACMELKKKGLVSNSLESFSHEKQKNYFKQLLLKRTNPKNLKSAKKRDEASSGLFKTLNRNLATKSRPREPTSVYSRLKVIQQETKNVDNVHLNIFQIEREIRRIKSDILQVKKSISLSKEINPLNLKRLNEKLTGKESELSTNELRLRALKEKQKRNKYDRNVKYF